MAYKVTKKKSVGDHLEQQLSREEGKAVSVDSQEKPSMRVQRSKYLAARRQGNYTNNAPTNTRYIIWD